MKSNDELVERSFEIMLIQENDAYELARTDDERRVHEARIKDIIKSWNEYKSTEDAERKQEIERLKIDETRKENNKLKIFDGIKTGLVAGLGLLGTLLGIKASRDNMKVLSEYERQNYIATTAEKEAVKSAIDVTGSIRKFEGVFKK